MRLIKDSIDLSGYMADEKEEHSVRQASDWTKDVIDLFWKPDESPKVRLPWLKTHSDFHLREGEVTLWAGINGHGKSQITGQMVHSLCMQNQRVALASLEMIPAKTMSRMVRQAFGADMPPAKYINDFGVWTNDRLWIYDHVGSSNAKTMAAVIRYSIEKFGIQHFVVDNLMKVVNGDQGERVYNEQKQFVDTLCSIAKETGCHIHLVLHVKKLDKETDVPSKFDIKGSGAITDLVDNVFIVWRNKAKEAALRMGDDFSPDDPDCLLILDKQRHGETEGRYRLYFDPASMQYLEDRNDLPKHHKIEFGVEAHEVEF